MLPVGSDLTAIVATVYVILALFRYKYFFNSLLGPISQKKPTGWEIQNHTTHLY